jgi:hypothetical protein
MKLIAFTRWRVALVLLLISNGTAQARLPEFECIDETRAANTIKIFGITEILTSALNQPGIYRIKEETELTPLEEMLGVDWKKNLSSLPLLLNENEHVAVTFEGPEVVLELLLADEEKGKIPQKIRISKTEFDELGLEFINSGSATSLATYYSPYEKIEQANRGAPRGRRARLHYRNPSGATSKGCVAYVQRAIGWSSGPTGNGRHMTTTLQRHGWRRLSDCSNPPVGAVASWTGGAKGSGHTAIWRKGYGWCYDLGCHDPGKRFRFLNCVARPE